jgi:AdoMet-dependent heme synthase
MNLDHAPMLVFWETTRSCLLACRHCRAEAIDQPLPGELTTEEARAFIEQVAGIGDRPPVLIMTGGDFLMRRDTFDLLAFAQSLGVPVGASPSVTPLLTVEALRRLREVGITKASISLDGATPRTHESIRGVDDHFDATLGALRSMLREGFTLQVNTTVMRDNVEELADVAALLVEIGVPIWEVFFLIKTGRGADVGELSPQENEDVAHFLFDASCYGLTVRTVEGPFFRRVAAWRRAAPPGIDPSELFGLGDLYRRLSSRLHMLVGEEPGGSKAQTARTRDGKGIVFVSYRGDVYPSGFLPLALGNVRTRSVGEIYRDDPMLRRIRAGAFTGRCGRCDLREVCGGSRARAFAASGDPLGEDPACPYEPAPTALLATPA